MMRRALFAAGLGMALAGLAAGRCSFCTFLFSLRLRWSRSSGAWATISQQS